MVGAALVCVGKVQDLGYAEFVLHVEDLVGLDEVAAAGLKLLAALVEILGLGGGVSSYQD